MHNYIYCLLPSFNDCEFCTVSKFVILQYANHCILYYCYMQPCEFSLAFGNGNLKVNLKADLKADLC